MRPAIFLVLLVAALPPRALASSWITIGWGDSVWGGMDWFSCDPQGQQPELFVSFVPPDEIADIHSVEVTLDFCTAPHPLPTWWFFDGADGCDPVELSVSADFTQHQGAHVDYWEGQASVSHVYTPQFGGDVVRGRLVVTVELDPTEADPVEIGTEYYAFRALFDGSSATCPGCWREACFLVNGITVEHSGGTTRFYGNDYSNYARWQGSNLGCPFIVETRSSTWGALKAQF